jgi:hypothetical protein
MKINPRGVNIIRAVGHKRGRRSTRPDKDHTKARLVFYQEAIIQMFPELPEKRPRNLVKWVREALAKNPEWTAQLWEEPISPTHVKRAWEALQKK